MPEKDIFKYILEECQIVIWQDFSKTLAVSMRDDEYREYDITIVKQNKHIKITQRYYITLFDGVTLARDYEYCDVICNNVVWELLVLKLNENDCFVIN